ncbi:MAG: SAM-dependent methyltransferase, partial [Bacteroidales bacterium]|nr:SAM-dependent methyltransferase [Bacteroidales bacterium]
IVNETNETQIFIETPYRNNALLEDICSACSEQTLLTIAVDITTETEMIKTMTIQEWKKKKPELHKRPAVFLLGKS